MYLPTVVSALDPDEAHAGISRTFCEHRLTPLAPGGRLRVVQRSFDLGGGLALGTLDYGGPVRVDVPDGLGDFFLLEVVLRGRMWVRHAGHEVIADPTRAVLVNPADRLLKEWSSDCRVLTVRVDRALWDTHVAAVTAAAGPDRWRPSPELDLSRPAAGVLVRALTGLRQALAQPALAADAGFVAGARDCALACLVPAVTEHAPRPWVPRPRVAGDVRVGQTIGQLIRRRRCEFGLTLAELARRLAGATGRTVTAQRVCDWEQGRVSVALDWLPALAVELVTPLDEFALAAVRTRTRRR